MSVNIFFYCNFDNRIEWEESIKKIFKKEKIFLLKDKPDFDKIDCAIVWNIPNNILKKLVNLKLIFSLGAGVDHILKLSNYKFTPIIRVKDPSMAKRMSYHVLSQILEYQLNLKFFQKAQLNRFWKEGLQFQRQVKLNEQITVGILGVGFLGTHVGKFLKKLVNLRVIFSLGAGVDHILKLSNYRSTPIIRVKDPSMAKRMSYHVLSQILEYQLNLKFFQKAQLRKSWQEELQFHRQVKLNEQINVGILGAGFLGQYVGKFLQRLDYKVIGFKKTAPKKKSSFPIYTNKDLDSFIKSSNIIISILPATIETNNFIDKKFLKKMKHDSLLINVGRGASINESDLISHLNKNKNFFASLDVFKKEPLIKKSLLWNLDNITITPHVASITQVDIITNQMYKKFLTFKKNKKIKTDVNLSKGY